MSGPQDLLNQLAAECEPAVVAAKEKYSDPYFSRKAVIYFIAAGNPPKAIKIGVTARDKIDARLRSIQSANHEQIRLLKVKEYLDEPKPGLRPEREEADLHIQFAALQRARPFTVGCEWFNYEESLATFIEDMEELPDDLKNSYWAG